MKNRVLQTLRYVALSVFVILVFSCDYKNLNLVQKKTADALTFQNSITKESRVNSNSYFLYKPEPLSFSNIFAVTNVSGTINDAETILPYIDRDKQIDYLMQIGKNYIVAGTESGVWITLPEGTSFQVADFTGVTRIEPHPEGYFLVCDEGVYFSTDLTEWSAKTDGLKEGYIKTYDGTNTALQTNFRRITDFEYDPWNPSNLIVSCIDGVCVSTNLGKQWIFVGTPSWTPGIKSVGIYSDKGKLYIMIGHPFQGFYVARFRDDIEWIENKSGLFIYEGIYEEISDLLLFTNDDKLRLIAANNFHLNADEYNFKKDKWIDSYRPETNFGFMESVTVYQTNFYYVTMNQVMRWEPGNSELNRPDTELTETVLNISSFIGEPAECVVIVSNRQPQFALHDLWLINDSNFKTGNQSYDDRKGFYIFADDLIDLDNSEAFESAIELLSATELNMLVIDMKDDNGYLRYLPRNEYVASFSNWNDVLDVERFLSACDSNDIYTCARVVLFKDKQMYHYDGGKYAIQDRYYLSPWRGYWTSYRKKTYASGYWVDIYCEDIWKYNVSIAVELAELGFDEIQFDYIRLPTDGGNLLSMRFDWNEYDLDYTSGLVSFLNYARERIPVPISVDIYGANCWHRISGTTQQNVEYISEYVDVICPMFYPSHFSDEFLDEYPAEMRPYRIYYQGSLRTFSFTRGKVAIRPWVQAFRMNVDYDRNYYGVGYISNEVLGVDQSVNRGYLFWNTSGDFSILADVFETDSGQE